MTTEANKKTLKYICTNKDYYVLADLKPYLP